LPHAIAHSTAAHRNAERTAAIASRSQAESRSNDGEISGGCWWGS
jgi:hypothetical protein